MLINKKQGTVLFDRRTMSREMLHDRRTELQKDSPPAISNKENQMKGRSDLLADRIEQGAAGLAAFAEDLTEAEWRTPVRDGRSVGVVVHHVASVYPIEIDLAKRIATGTPVTEVPWEAVNAMNAEHARNNAGVGKTETLALLRRNASEAAAAVRSMSDVELDKSAPFSLSYGAPVTSQFVIEDHALRHSWHHLARIREAVGK
jgi:hypothetical protein